MAKNKFINGRRCLIKTDDNNNKKKEVAKVMLILFEEFLKPIKIIFLYLKVICLIKDVVEMGFVKKSDCATVLEE